MTTMNIQLKVIKADGSVEDYLHTKVIGTISSALADIDQADTHVAEQLAEVVTYFLYHKQKRYKVTSGEILSVVKAVLDATKYEDAAIALTEYHFERRLKRSRIEVVLINIQRLDDAHLLAASEQHAQRLRWDKSRIVADLVANHDVPRQVARTIASMVEEKIFSLGITLVPASLIKQLVMADTAAVLRAQQQLQTA